MRAESGSGYGLHAKASVLHRSSIKESVASPPDTQLRQSAARGAPGERIVHSRLHAIVMQHLRHQHKAACLKAAAPISTLPPMSLLRPKTLPQVPPPSPYFLMI